MAQLHIYFFTLSPMYPEENACSTGINYPTSTRSIRETLQDTRPSELTEIFEQVGTNRNRIGMTAQRLRDFLQRTKGNFPMADGSAVKRPERQGTL